MYTGTATSSEQCFKGTFVIFIEDRKSTFVCAINLFVCKICYRIARSKGNNRFLEIDFRKDQK